MFESAYFVLKVLCVYVRVRVRVRVRVCVCVCCVISPMFPST